MKIFFVACFAVLIASCHPDNGGHKTAAPKAENTAGEGVADRIDAEIPVVGQHAQLKILDSNLSAAQLPSEIVYKGILRRGIHFEDQSAEQWLVFSEVEPYDPAEEGGDYEGSNVELYASLYTKKDHAFIKKWQVYDFISVCPVELLARFIPSSIQLTDLNGDGVAEIWMMYQTTCQGDVSPQTMKLIMYEGNKKYAAKGENKISAGEGVTFGGKVKMDAAFLNADTRILDFARQLWKKNERFVFPNE